MPSREDAASLMSLPRDVVAQVVMPYLTLLDANVLRVCNRELRDAVLEAPFVDARTLVAKPAAWRAVFPRARALNISSRLDAKGRLAPGECARILRGGDLAAVAGVATVVAHGLMTTRASDLAQLRGVRSLDLGVTNSRYSYQLSAGAIVGAEALAVLVGAGLRKLSLAGCRGVTDATVAACKGVLDLDVSGCADLTDAAFAALAGVQRLALSSETGGWWSRRQRITDAALKFVASGGVRELDVSACAAITDAGLLLLAPTLRVLSVRGLALVTNAGVGACSELVELDASRCSRITDAVLGDLPKLKKLVASTVRHSGSYFRRERGPVMRNLARMAALESLDISGAAHVSGSLALLRNVRALDLSFCGWLDDARLRELAAGLRARGAALDKLVLRKEARVTAAGIAALAGVVHGELDVEFINKRVSVAAGFDALTAAEGDDAEAAAAAIAAAAPQKKPAAQRRRRIARR